MYYYSPPEKRYLIFSKIPVVGLWMWSWLSSSHFEIRIKHSTSKLRNESIVYKYSWWQWGGIFGNFLAWLESHRQKMDLARGNKQVWFITQNFQQICQKTFLTHTFVFALTGPLFVAIYYYRIPHSLFAFLLSPTSQRNLSLWTTSILSYTMPKNVVLADNSLKNMQK